VTGISSTSSIQSASRPGSARSSNNARRWDAHHRYGPRRHRHDRTSPAVPITRICAWNGPCRQLRSARASRWPHTPP
jgi:hypothetical protein